MNRIIVKVCVILASKRTLNMNNEDIRTPIPITNPNTNRSKRVKFFEIKKLQRYPGTVIINIPVTSLMSSYGSIGILSI